MQEVFYDTRFLDLACRETFYLSEDLMMENAAAGMEKILKGKKSVLILCGGGNNGGDGYALARRMISENVFVGVVECVPAKSEMCCLQKNRAESCGVKIQKLEYAKSFIEETKFEAVVDCIFGTGFHGALPENIASIVQKINNMDMFKLACDVPSGLDLLGNANGKVFMADETVTMGALKLLLFSDVAKDVCGKITVSNLGVSRCLFEKAFENQSGKKYFMLEESDCNLPHRKKQNVNKGSYGHTTVIGGEKIGAAVIASSAALRFGSGLVTLVSFDKIHESGEKINLDEKGLPSTSIVPYEIMCSESIPVNTTAVAMGMGLGRNSNIGRVLNYLEENPLVPVLLDADIFYNKDIKSILEQRSLRKMPTVLTPHPKEFSVLLENCGLGSYSVKEVIGNRIELVEKFCTTFPNVVLLLKGATVLIAEKSNENFCVYFNPHGCSALSKAGSGDVLDGLIVGLLAQKYSVMDATVTASLAHAFASKKIVPDFSLTPFRLLENVL